MVQVDVFWSYGLGAGMAVAASEQLQRAATRGEDPLSGPHFARMLLFIAAIFAPSGICLLWAFPSWETMHVGTKDMPAWLVTAFALTNVTQGVAGFLIARHLIKNGRRYRAFLHFVGAYFAMFFILVHGWDGTGYQRFFSATRDEFLHWQGAGQVWSWFGSDVAWTLYGMGVVLLPVLLGLSSRWMQTGFELDGASSIPTRGRLSRDKLVAVFGLGLLPAIAASVSIHHLGWFWGGGAFAAAAYLLIVRRGSLGWRLCSRMVPLAAER